MLFSPPALSCEDTYWHAYPLMFLHHVYFFKKQYLSMKKVANCLKDLHCWLTPDPSTGIAFNLYRFYCMCFQGRS